MLRNKFHCEKKVKCVVKWIFFCYLYEFFSCSIARKTFRPLVFITIFLGLNHLLLVGDVLKTESGYTLANAFIHLEQKFM